MKWIIGIIIAAAIAAGVWYYYYTKKKSSQTSATSQASSDATAGTGNTGGNSAGPQLGTISATPIVSSTPSNLTNLSGTTPGNLMAGYGAMSGVTPPAISQGTVTISPVVSTHVSVPVPAYTGGIMSSNG